MGVAAACRQEACTPVRSELHTSMHGSAAAASFLQSFSSPTVSGGGGGTGGLVGIHVFSERGGG